jgi:hypothetical protein
MQEWEYLHLRRFEGEWQILPESVLPEHWQELMLERILGHLGALGWELVSVSGDGLSHFYFKRPKHTGAVAVREG